MIKALTGAASSSKDEHDSDKPRVKEAEKIVFPAFLNPENYRNWRVKAREAVVAASDRTDKAFEWLSAVWNKDKTVELLRDPEGFATLDAKILPAVTNIVSGDIDRQVDTFKEREAHHDRLVVSGRQVLLMMDRYFSTNALHGSVYDIEDLLSVTMVNEKLEVFMRSWDTVLSGIKKGGPVFRRLFFFFAFFLALVLGGPSCLSAGKKERKKRRVRGEKAGP